MPRIDLAERLSDARARVLAEPDLSKTELPKFATMTRKEALLRDDQLAGLTVLAKTLMAKRHSKTERITENTLIRVAIDLLLAQSGALVGSTEEELTESVRTPVRESGSPGVRLFGPPAVRECRTTAPPWSGRSAGCADGLRQRSSIHLLDHHLGSLP